MPTQLMMSLKTKKDTGLRWVLYIEAVVKGQEAMVPLLNEAGKPRLFESYQEAIAEKSDRPLSVIGTANANDIKGTVYNIAHTQNVTCLA